MLGFEGVHGAGRTPVGQRIDEHQRIPAVEQVVGQVHAPDAVVDRAHLRSVRVDMAHHLGAEAVVSEEYVADPGNQYPGRDEFSLSSHAAYLQVTLDVGDGLHPDHRDGEDHDGHHRHRDPTDYFHGELLPVSGSTSSGAKYR
ncbi:hypothetical protein GCM10010409_41290 [Mycolicibacterium diernhoferi]